MDVATMPTVLDLVFRTEHISNTGLNITNIDGDLVVANGFVQSDVINVSTLNYNSLNPPIATPTISSIVSNNTIDIIANGFTSYINLSTGGNSGVNIINGNTTTMAINGSGVQMLLSDGLSITPTGGGGGGQSITQYPLVPIGANEYYQQGWDGIGGAGTDFIAGTQNYGSYQLTSADGTVVIQNNLSVNGNASASNLTANNSITANTGSVSSLNVSTINNYNLASDTANISTLTVSTLNNLNALPTGITFFPDIAWNSTIGSEWVGTASAPGLTEGSLISATLQLRPGYTYSDITTSEYCWLITTFPSTNTLTYFVASDPTTASSNVAISWAMTR